MRRRNYRFEIVQVLLSLAIIVLTVLLFLKAREHTVLFPVTFGLAFVLAVLNAMEGVLINKNRVIRKSRVVFLGAVALLLLALTYVSARTVLG